MFSASKIAAPSAAYQISRSLRFNSADSAYLNRTFGTATNQSVFTLSIWEKLSNLSTVRQLFGVSTNHSFGFTAGNALNLTFGGVSALTTTSLYRDPSAFSHIMWVQNGSSHTIYFNGVSVGTATATSSVFNTAVSHQLGAANTTSFYDGYMTEINFIDGQALAPSSFGQTNATTGAWDPIKYTGAYGTNGFYLNFSDNSGTTATTLGKDTSGNANNWTPNNFSVTAGAGNDSLTDTPTNYGTDTGAGGEVRGNFCVWNAAEPTASLISDGGLVAQDAKGTMPVFDTQKYYWEVTINNAASNCRHGIGKSSAPPLSVSTYTGSPGSDYLMWRPSSATFEGASSSSYGSAPSAGDTLGFAYDGATGKYWIRNSGGWFASGDPSAGTNPGATVSFSPWSLFSVTGTGGQTNTINTGQRSFAYTAPTGFKSLCTQNLADSAVKKPSTGFFTKLYTGTGSALSITGLNFSPDLVWIKSRSAATDNTVYDAQRGAEKRLETNQADAEVTSDGGVTAFNSDGFTLGTLAQVNTNTATYVAWCWEESATYGFDIVLYTGTGSAQAVNHSLGAAPGFITAKDRTNGSTSWRTYHSALGATKYLNLQNTDSVATSAIAWNNTTPTSSQFTVGTDLSTNTANFVAYLWAPIAGFSAFGSYTGNGSADGPVMALGFKPAWALLKVSSSANSWVIRDNKTSPYNPATAELIPNLANAETTGAAIDFLAAGLKIRATSLYVNESGSTFIFATFAQDNFKNARAV